MKTQRDRIEELGKVLEGGSKFKVGAFSFEEPDMDMLVSNSDCLDDHIIKQPAGMAFYGALFRQAQREHDDLEKAWKYRWLEMYSDATKQVSSAKATGRVTISDVEAKAHELYKDEIALWEKRVSDSRRRMDDAEMFYEGWKSKSFSLHQLANIMVAGLMTSETEGKSADPQAERRVQRVAQTLRQSMTKTNPE